MFFVCSHFKIENYCNDLKTQKQANESFEQEIILEKVFELEIREKNTQN